MPIWAKSYTGGYQSQVERIAYDPVNDHVIIAGEAMGGSIDLHASTGVVAAGMFLAAIDTNGNTLWSTGCSDFTVGGLKVDSSGNIDIGGNSSGSSATACRAKSFSPNPNAGSNVILAQAAADGTPQWLHGITGAGVVARVNDIAIAPDDSIWFGGILSGTSDFYGGSQVHGGAALVGEFLIGHAESDGTPDVAFGINDGRPYSMLLDLDCVGAASLAVDTQSTVYVTASLCGTMNFGGTTLSGQDEVVTAALDFTGQWLWAESFGDPAGSSAPAAIALQPSGDIMIGGRTFDRADFGLGVFLTGNASYTFLARLNAAGPTTPAAPVWNDFYGGSKMDRNAYVSANAMVTSPRAQPSALDVVLVGTYVQAADFGTGSQPQSGSQSAFVMKVAP